MDWLLLRVPWAGGGARDTRRVALPRDVVDTLRVRGRDPAEHRQRRLPTEIRLEAAAVVSCSRELMGGPPGVRQRGAAASFPARARGRVGGATTRSGLTLPSSRLVAEECLRVCAYPRTVGWRVSSHSARNRFMHRRRPRKFRLTRSRQWSSTICFDSCRPFTGECLLSCSSSCCRSFFLQVIASCTCLKTLNIVLLSKWLHLLFSFDNRFELCGIQNSRCQQRKPFPLHPDFPRSFLFSANIETDFHMDPDI